jgi:hypothetical protein
MKSRTLPKVFFQGNYLDQVPDLGEAPGEGGAFVREWVEYRHSVHG